MRRANSQVDLARRSNLQVVSTRRSTVQVELGCRSNLQVESTRRSNSENDVIIDDVVIETLSPSEIF